MSNGRKPSIDQRIIELLSNGPMDCSQMVQHIPFKYKSISSKCLELEKHNLIKRDADRVWSLRPGVTPQTLETGELESTEGTGEEAGAAPTQPKPGIPLDQKGMFIKHMTDIGVGPKDAIPTIADLFFGGDIDDLNWLNHVLQRQAAGYVNHHQRRLIMGWWAQTRGLPYDEDEFYWPPERGEKGSKGAKETKEEEPRTKPLDTGQGWRVGKDRAGDWCALPGGPMTTYQEATDAAERRALIASYQVPTAEGEEEETVEEGEGKPARRGGKPRESVVDYMMRKLVDDFVGGRRDRGEGENETVKKLQSRIDQMDKDRVDQRFERLEGIIADVASRDPWDEYDRINKMKERLGTGTSAVTDQSPAVQLIKDSTEKVDKNVGRLVGLVERAALRSEEFRPEETRTADAKEQKAGELLDEAQKRSRDRGLRKSLFDA